MMLSISTAMEALRQGKTSSVRLTEAALAAADELDATLGTYLARFDCQALAAAAKADEELAAGAVRGPLHGIPLAIKDNIATSETRSTAQSVVAHAISWREPDAVVAARLRSGGAVILGKTTLMEFGIGLPDTSHGFPIPRNPWDINTWAGGSSSGTANGVAAGLFFGGLGTDTGGSIRIPAAFCGVTGLKPTFGLVPRCGTIPLGFSLDTIGPIARSARDCAILLTQIAGMDDRDPSTIKSTVPNFLAELGKDLTGVRLGVDRRAQPPSEAHTVDAFSDDIDATIRVFEKLGAEVVDVEIPYYDELTTCTMIGELAEAFAYHRRNLREHWSEYGHDTRMTLASGALISGADFVQAQRVRRVGRQAVGGMFKEFDAVITPTVSGAAPALPLSSFDDVVAAANTPIWNATGNPAVSVPIGFDAAGLPLGMQIAGDILADGLVLCIADAFQARTEWHTVNPPLNSNQFWAAAGVEATLQRVRER